MAPTKSAQRAPDAGTRTSRRERRAKEPRKPTRDEQAANAALGAAGDRERKKTEPFEWALSNGVVLRIKPVPPLAVGAAAQKVQRPPVPLCVINPDEPDRLEENPNDPDYLKAMAEADEIEAQAANNIALLLGVDIVSVPDDMHNIEADGWIEDLEWLGLAEFDRGDERARRLHWLKYYALRTHEDIAKAMSSPMLLAGVSEEEVRQVVAAFRSFEERRATGGGATPDAPEHGDRDPAGRDDSPSVRGTGSGPVHADSVDDVDEAPEG